MLYRTVLFIAIALFNEAHLAIIDPNLERPQQVIKVLNNHHVALQDVKTTVKVQESTTPMIENKTLPHDEAWEEVKVPVQKLIENRQGRLQTVGLGTTSKRVKITWNFTFAEDVILALDMNKLVFPANLSAPCVNCCAQNGLQLPKNHQGLLRYCPDSQEDKIISDGKKFVLTFASEYAAQGVQLEFSIRHKTEACSNSSFKCFDEKRCYNVSNICNGKFDCEDHTDEQNCGKCRTNYTLCNNDDHIVTEQINCFHPELQRCDGILHCPKGEDELNCVKKCRHQIQCADKSGCYTPAQRCDGKKNCKDHSDEAHCDSTNCEVLANTSNYFVCNNGWCIKKALLHNAIKECDDGSDEVNHHMDEIPMICGLLVILVLILAWISLIPCPQLFGSNSKPKSQEQPVETEQTPKEPCVAFKCNKHPPKRNASAQVAFDSSDKIEIGAVKESRSDTAYEIMNPIVIM